MHINPAIVRSYDIRGLYPNDLNEEVAYNLGRSLGSFMIRQNLKSIVVGRDNRYSSISLSNHFIKGLLESGCNVTDAGLCAKPTTYFVSLSHSFDAGVIVTASHNPKEFNGFKINFANAKPFFGEDLKQLLTLSLEENYENGEGKLTHNDFTNQYAFDIVQAFDIKKSFRIVVNCGNAVSGLFAPHVLNELGSEVIMSNCELNSDFPHGTPNPENTSFMKNISSLVLHHNADVGFGFDTDMDRFGLIDEKGQRISNDKLLMLFAKYELASNPGSTVIYDVKSSESLKKAITDFGGVPKMLRTGNPYFIEEIHKGALLGAEFSGHFYFKAHAGGYDDALWAGCKVLEILDRTGKKLSELTQDFPDLYHTGEIKVECPDEFKFQVVDTVEEMVGSIKNVKSITRIDGLRVRMTEHGWFLIRASNTTPNLSIRAEGESNEEALLMLSHVKDLLSRFELLDLRVFNNPEIVYS